MFREALIESEKMRTKNGFDYPIAKVKKAQKLADSIDMSDSRIIAGMILDWCSLNKVKIDDVITKVNAGEIDKALAKKAFNTKNLRKLTPAGKELLGKLKD